MLQLLGKFKNCSLNLYWNVPFLINSQWSPIQSSGNSYQINYVSFILKAFVPPQYVCLFVCLCIPTPPNSENYTTLNDFLENSRVSLELHKHFQDFRTFRDFRRYREFLGKYIHGFSEISELSVLLRIYENIEKIGFFSRTIIKTFL